MNRAKVDVKGRVVLLGVKSRPGTDMDRLFLCEDGFGCKPENMGTAIFGRFVLTGTVARIDGREIERLATADEIERARAASAPAKAVLANVKAAEEVEEEEDEDEECPECGESGADCTCGEAEPGDGELLPGSE